MPIHSAGSTTISGGFNDVPETNFGNIIEKSTSTQFVQIIVAHMLNEFVNRADDFNLTKLGV